MLQYLPRIQPQYLAHVKEHLLFTLEESIVVMLLIAYASKFVHAALSLVLTQKYDNVQSSYRTMSVDRKKEEDAWKTQTLQRAYTAHLNHWEACVGFFAAVLLALRSKNLKQNEEELRCYAHAFLASRVLYNIAFIVGFNVPLSLVRTAIFTSGFVCLLHIFRLAFA